MGKKEHLVDHDRRQKDPARLSPVAWGVIVTIMGSITAAGGLAALILPTYDQVLTSQSALLMNLVEGICIVAAGGTLLCLLRSTDRTNEGMRQMSHDLKEVKQVVEEHLRAEQLRAISDITAEIFSGDTETETPDVADTIVAETISHVVADANRATETTSENVALGDTQEIVVDRQAVREQRRAEAENEAQQGRINFSQFRAERADTVEINAEQVRALTHDTSPLDEDDRTTLDELPLTSGGLSSDELAHLQVLIEQFNHAVTAHVEAQIEPAEAQIEPAEAQIEHAEVQTETLSVPSTAVECAQDQDVSTVTALAEESHASSDKVVYLQVRREDTPEEKRARLQAEIREYGLNVSPDELRTILRMANCSTYSELPQSYKDILLNRTSQNAGTKNNVAAYRGA